MGSRLMCFHPQTDRPNTQKGKAKAKVKITSFSHTPPGHVARGACARILVFAFAFTFGIVLGFHNPRFSCVFFMVAPVGSRILALPKLGSLEQRILHRVVASNESTCSPPPHPAPVASEMCSLPKEYPKLRRESELKSTPPTHSAHQLWSTQVLARVAPHRLHAHLQCHCGSREVLPP